jgi:hypothetical protein
MTPHTLVVGGTGMLSSLCLELASRGQQVSVLARSHARLSALSRRAPNSIFPIPADYTEDQHLAAALRAAAVARGPFSLAIAWIHSTAPRASQLIAETIAGSPSRPCRFFHIRGSAASDPSPPSSEESDLLAIPGIAYHCVTLGFIVEHGRSRWLTDEEICREVLAAIDKGLTDHVAGQVSPWGLAPRT